MKRLLLLTLALGAGLLLRAQLLTWSPPFPREADPAQNLVLTLDATKGNTGLLHHTPGDVYVHIGVITNKSANGNDWKYVKWTNFNAPGEVVKATSLGNNKWQYTIAGSLRSFFGITDGTETIQKIALLFRSGNGAKKQANRDGSDMYLPVYGAGPAVRFLEPGIQPQYRPTAEQPSVPTGTFTGKALVSGPADFTFYLNGQPVYTEAGVTDTATWSYTLPSDGIYQLVAEASYNGTVRRDTLNLAAGNLTSPVAALPAGARDGINYQPGDTSALLVLHAPGKNLVAVVGDFNGWAERASDIMYKTPDGQKFWVRLTGLTPGTEYAYQYKVDNSLFIADPYTEKVLDPGADGGIPSTTYPGLKPYPTGKASGIVSVLQTGAPVYTWGTTGYTRPDKRGLIIYELLVRDFLAAHDWNTVRDTLGYLKRLGVNAIELMPFNEFEHNNSWGYNSSFYFAPDKYYGPAQTLKRFIDSCHAHGIAVIMDLALNHQFGQSPLVQLYWDAANNRPAANSPWFNPVAKHPFNVGYDM
ncbi:MAG TPA: alpha-amylase family glycosyl hydrolase, partial [Chitinophagaceae bacterium]|nr:alpha-amylase family glycosyl hydrolase [Chitinophagaceae bacterium]